MDRVQTRVAVLGGNHEPVHVNSYEVWVPPAAGAQQGSWQQFTPGVFEFPGPAGQYMGTYPYAHLMSNGQLVVSPFIGGTWSGGVFTPALPQPSTLRHAVQPGVWTTFNNDAGRIRYRTWGCSLLAPNLDASHANSLMVLGGGLTPAGPSTTDLQMSRPQHHGPPTAGCWPGGYWWTDLPGAPSPCSTMTPLSVSRYAANAVLLPDGSFLVIGGGVPGAAGVQDTNSIVRWDAGQWNECASLLELVPGVQGGYGFHSTALLLPDGRVLIGAGNPFAGEPWPRWDYQVYRPWYLVNDVVRPTILSVNGGAEDVRYGQSFTITHVVVPGMAVDKVVLIRPSSVTHGANTEQRYIELETVKGNPPGQITALMPAKAPSDPSITLADVSGPPGYYMVFLVSSARVPSVAGWVRLVP